MQGKRRQRVVRVVERTAAAAAAYSFDVVHLYGREERCGASKDHTLAGSLRQGHRESRRCSWDTHPESYIIKDTSIRRVWKGGSTRGARRQNWLAGRDVGRVQGCVLLRCGAPFEVVHHGFLRAHVPAVSVLPRAIVQSQKCESPVSLNPQTHFDIRAMFAPDVVHERFKAPPRFLAPPARRAEVELHEF